MSTDATVASITLFCPECGHGLSGAPEELSAPRVCRECGKKVTLVDYTRETISVPPEPKRAPSATWADQLFRALAVIAAVLAVLALYSIWSGAATAAQWIGVGCLILAAPLVLAFAQLKRKALHAEEMLNRTQRALKISNARLESAAEVNRGFQKHIAKVAAEEKRRLQQQFSTQLHVIEEKKEDAEWRMRRADDQFKVVRALGDRLLSEALERISLDVTPRNFEASRRRLAEVIAFCRENDYNLTPRREEEMMAQLMHRYNAELRLEQQRQQRDAVAARLAAEQRVHDQMGYEITRAEAHRSAIRKRLSEAQAAAETAESSSTTLKRLKTELFEAEQRAKQASAIAHHPRAGHVLVLSNVGSLGERILKIWLSRSIDPLEAAKELAREALPFPYDVHMCVSSENALGLISTLYEQLHQHRVNRIDLSKDFFRVDVDTVWQLITAHHGTVECKLVAPAEEFRESQTMSADRFRHISEVMKAREHWATDAR